MKRTWTNININNNKNKNNGHRRDADEMTPAEGDYLVGYHWGNGSSVLGRQDSVGPKSKQSASLPKVKHNLIDTYFPESCYGFQFYTNPLPAPLETPSEDKALLSHPIYTTQEELKTIVRGLAISISSKIYVNQYVRIARSESPYPLKDILWDELFYPICDNPPTFSLFPHYSQIEAFLWKIVQARDLPVEMLVTAGYYLEKLEITQNKIYCSNWRCLLLVALLIANKFVGDFTVWNGDWVSSVFSQMSLKSIHQLERNFLRALDYRLYVAVEEYAVMYLAYANLAMVAEPRMAER